MWEVGISVSAVRITPPSTPFSVRTSVVTAKAIIKRLAAIPSRFQPIHFLKPSESPVSSPCIHPPGGAAQIGSSKVEKPSKPPLENHYRSKGNSSHKAKSV